MVLAGLLCVGILHSRREEQARAEALNAINKQLGPLRSRKLKLEAELETLEKEPVEQLGGMATLSLLVTDLSGDFAEQIIPDLQDAGVPAVMAVSQTQFPGNAGCITLEEFQERLDAGWDYCLA